jgi:peptidoglycan/xylan/chitin deacetylase (PgdA/CDA1 family)
MKKILAILAVGILLLSSCAVDQKNNDKPIIPKDELPIVETKISDHEVNSNAPDFENPIIETSAESTSPDFESITIKYQNEIPRYFGETVEGVVTRIETTEKIIALTFDACGGKNGLGYDQKLIDYIIEEEVPATLFINGRWIDENQELFLLLSQNELFEIENHGYAHKPLSVNGKSIYGIEGTQNVPEIIDEVWKNATKIEVLTGRRPLYFRSGTAYYDEVAVKIVRDLDEKPVNFTILGDAGAKYTKSQMVKSAKGAKNGSIILYHMNHPEGATAEGMTEVIPMLREKGFEFVLLKDYEEAMK